MHSQRHHDQRLDDPWIVAAGQHRRQDVAQGTVDHRGSPIERPAQEKPLWIQRGRHHAPAKADPDQHDVDAKRDLGIERAAQGILGPGAGFRKDGRNGPQVEGGNKGVPPAPEVVRVFLGLVEAVGDHGQPSVPVVVSSLVGGGQHSGSKEKDRPRHKRPVGLKPGYRGAVGIDPSKDVRSRRGGSTQGHAFLSRCFGVLGSLLETLVLAILV
mmetsp:Transcript_10067/g.29682  ORF Transcript_10067/g.29682 Transcript_10067/m.29682 type:complete len:213 (+) Transcript_10067:368-1006(+)